MSGKTKPDTRDVQVKLSEIQWTDQQMRCLNVMTNKMLFDALPASIILESIFSDQSGPARGRRGNNNFSMENYQKHKKLHDDVVRNPKKGNIVWLKQVGNGEDAKEREAIETTIRLVAKEKDFPIHETPINIEDDDTNLARAAQKDEEQAGKKRKHRPDAQSQDEQIDANVGARINTRAQTGLTDMASPLSIVEFNNARINSARAAVNSGKIRPRASFATSPVDQINHQRAHDQLAHHRARHRSSDRPFVRSGLAASETVNTEAPSMNNTVVVADGRSIRDAATVNRRSAQEDIVRIMSTVVEAGPDGNQDFDVQVTTTTQRTPRPQQGPSSDATGRVYFSVKTTMTIKRRPPQ